MSFRYFLLLLILPLVLVACTDTTPTQVVVTENPISPTTYPGPINSTIPAYPNPEPTMDTRTPENPAYPDPGSVGTGTPVIPPSGYEPQPGDATLKRDKVFLDLENSSLLVMESYPIQVSATLNGSLSDPCHQLRVVVTPANEQNHIEIEVYSVYDPNEICITVIQPFNVNIPLGSFVDGQYNVYVNGELLGEFDA